MENLIFMIFEYRFSEQRVLRIIKPHYNGLEYAPVFFAEVFYYDARPVQKFFGFINFIGERLQFASVDRNVSSRDDEPPVARCRLYAPFHVAHGAKGRHFKTFAVIAGVFSFFFSFGRCANMNEPLITVAGIL